MSIAERVVCSSPGHAAAPSAGAEPDAGLIEGLRSGRPGSAEALYRSLVQPVRRAVQSVLRHCPNDHDDLIQVTLERVIKTVVNGTYRGECSLRYWAVGIASRAAIDHQRALHREQRALHPGRAVDDDGTCPDYAHAEPAYMARAELARVLGILSRMRPLDAQALVLHHAVGYTLRETAAALGVSEAAAASRLARARRELLRRADCSVEPRLTRPGSGDSGRSFASARLFPTGRSDVTSHPPAAQ